MLKLDVLSAELNLWANETEQVYRATREMQYRRNATHLRYLAATLNQSSILAGVTSFNTRTGDVTLLSADVVSALGYTPVTQARTLTINGLTQDLSANRSWTISTATPNLDQVTTAGNTTTNAITVGGFTSNASSTIIGAATGTIGTRVLTVEGSLPEIWFKDTFSAADSFVLSKYGSIFYFARTSSTGTFINYAGAIRPSGASWSFGHGGNPSATVHIKGSDVLSSTKAFLVQNSSPSDLLTIWNDGAVGINTSTNAGYKLDVNGTARINNHLYLTNSSFTGTMSITLTANNQITFGNSGIGNWLQAGPTNRVFILQEFNSTVRGNYLGNGVGTTAVVISTLPAQSSGTNALTGLQLSYNINHTGTYSGIARGIYYNPTLTSLTGTTHRSIETVTGDVILGSTSGNLAVGTTTTLAKVTVAGSITAALALAQGVYFNNTLVAAANNDVLVGLDINPTFTNGAFTGIQNIGVRSQGTVLIEKDYGLGSNSLTSLLTLRKTSASAQSISLGYYTRSTTGVDSVGISIDTSYMMYLAGSTIIGGYQSSGLFTFGQTPAGSNFVTGTNILAHGITLSGSVTTTISTATASPAIYSAGITSASMGDLVLQARTSVTNKAIYLVTGGATATTAMIVFASTNVAIGTTTDAGYKLDVNGTARIVNKTNIGSETVSQGSLYVGHNGTAGGNNGTSTVFFVSQFGNYPYKLGAEGNGYDFYLRQANGGQGSINIDFSGLNSISYNITNTNVLNQSFGKSVVIDAKMSLNSYLAIGTRFGFSDSLTAGDSPLIFFRSMSGSYYDKTLDAAVTIRNGLPTVADNNITKNTAYWYRNGYIGIGTSTTLSATNTLKGAITINQGTTIGYQNLTPGSLSSVITSGTSTIVTFTPTNGNGVPGYDIIVGTIITANGVSRRVTAVNYQSVTVDSAVDWSAGYNYTYRNPYVSIADGATPIFDISPSGNVGIGTTPIYKLDVNGAVRFQSTGTSSVTHEFLFRNDNSAYGGFTIGSSGQPLSIQQASGYGYISAAGFRIGSTNGSIWTNNGSVFRISNPAETITYFRIHDTTGNVSINNSTDAGYKLDVNGTARFQGDLTAAGITSLGSNNAIWAYDRDVSSRPNDSFRITRLYGYTSFADRTYVGGFEDFEFLNFTHSTSGSSTLYLKSISDIQLHTNNTSVLNITSSGRVGIGTATPSYPFHISSAAAANIYGTVQSTSASGTAAWVAFNDQSDNVVYRVFGSGASGTQMGIALARTASLIANLGGAGSFLLGTYSATNFIMGTGNAEKMRIVDSTGNILIATTTDLGNKLEVNGTINATDYKVGNVAGWNGIINIPTMPPVMITVTNGIITNVM